MTRFRFWLIRLLGGNPPLRLLPRPEPTYMAGVREQLRDMPLPELRLPDWRPPRP